MCMHVIKLRISIVNDHDSIFQILSFNILIGIRYYQRSKKRADLAFARRIHQRATGFVPRPSPGVAGRRSVAGIIDCASIGY
jgi:hypothetical protein